MSLLLALLLAGTPLLERDQYHWLAQPRAAGGALAWLEQTSGYGPRSEAGLYVADAAARQPVKVSDQTDRAGIWSPDATRLAWLDADQALHSVRADGQDARLEATEASACAWSPAGAVLACETLAGELRVGGRTLLRGGPWDGFGWSRDGRSLAAWTDGRCQVVRVADGRARRLPQRDVTDAAWLPDGRLAVACGTSRVTVWLGGRRRLVRTGRDGSLAWSPRGDRFALAWTRAGRPVIGLYRLDGRPLGGLLSGSAPRWSRSGEWLAWTTDAELRVCRADGGGEQVVLRQAGLAADYDWLAGGLVVAREHALRLYTPR